MKGLNLFEVVLPHYAMQTAGDQRFKIRSLGLCQGAIFESHVFISMVQAVQTDGLCPMPSLDVKGAAARCMTQKEVQELPVELPRVSSNLTNRAI